MEIKELLDKLVSSELLTEETKTEVKAELEKFITETVAAAKVEAEEKVRLELTEQFVVDKEALIEALDSKSTELLVKEMAEFKDDVERFRDLEAEYATKEVENKKQMAETVKADLATLVERLDEFLEQRLTEELTELKEDIDQVKKLEFGRKIFEAVASEYGEKYVDKDEASKKLVETNQQLENMSKALETANTKLNAYERNQKMGSVLEALQGRPKEVMEAILAKVPTEKLEETYKKYIGRVLHESVTDSKVEESTDSEKENDDSSVLAEGKDHSTGTDTGAKTKLVTGDSPVVEKEEPTTSGDVSKLDESKKERLRELGGILKS